MDDNVKIMPKLETLEDIAERLTPDGYKFVKVSKVDCAWAPEKSSIEIEFLYKV